MGHEATVLSVSAGVRPSVSKTTPVILSVDLNDLEGRWKSQPNRLHGLSPAQMVARVASAPGNMVAAAVFGLAPALDFRGETETTAALAILNAVVTRIAKGAP